MTGFLTAKQLSEKFPLANLSNLPTTNPGGGKPWLSGGAVVVGNYAGNTVDWSAIANKPTEFTPTAHTHDDRYYTKSQIDAGYAKLSGGNSFSGNQVVTGNITASGTLGVGGSANSLEYRADVAMLGFNGQLYASTGVAIGSAGFRPGVNLGQNAKITWTNDTPASTPQATLERSGTAIIAKGDGGFYVRNLVGSADGPLYASSAVFSAQYPISLRGFAYISSQANNEVTLHDSAVSGFAKLNAAQLTLNRPTAASYGVYACGKNASGYVDWELNEGLIAGTYGGSLTLRAGDAANTGYVRLRYDQGYPKLETNQTFTFIGSGFQNRFSNAYIDWQLNSQTYLTLSGGTGGAALLSTVAAGTKGLIVKGVASQTGNYFEAQDSAGNAGFTVRPSSAGAATQKLAVYGPSGDSECVIGVTNTIGGAPTCGFGLGDANTGILTTSSGHSAAWRLRGDTTSGGIISYAGVHISQQGGANNNPRGSIWCNTSNVFQFHVYGGTTPAAMVVRAGGTKFVNGLHGTAALELTEISPDGRMSIRNSLNTGSSIDFWHSGFGILNNFHLGSGFINPAVKWGSFSGNSNNLIMYQSSASGADATVGIVAERYADATAGAQPRLNLYAKRIGFVTKSADTYLISGVVEQAYIDTNGLTVNNNINANGYVSSAFRSLSANPTTLDIASGLEQLVKNTTSGELRRWANDGGSMKSILYA